MNQNRFLALLLAGVMTLSLALTACGGKDNEPDPTPSVEPTAEATAEPTEDAQPSATPDPEETGAPETDAPGTAAPAEDSKAPAAGSAVDAVWKDIAKLDLPAFMDMDDEVLNAFYGLDVADLEEYVGKIPMMNVQATEFFIAKVKPGKMDTVKTAVEGRVDDLVAQWSQYLPEQLELVEDARVVTNGDYIMLAISEHADDAVKAFNDHTK